jgi:UDP-N-acetylmuramyl pentapeptide synthase
VGGVSALNLKILGEHHATNALASAAAAHSVGIAEEVYRERHTKSGTRRALEDAADCTAPTEFTVINDAYNASPDSTKAALHNLAQWQPATAPSRYWAKWLNLANFASRARHHRSPGSSLQH